MSPFRPPAWLANRHLQSILPSLPLRRPAVERRARAVMAASKPLILDCGDGVRLMGWHAESPAGAGPPRLAVLLHGWEGSADSLYLLSLAQLLFARGVSVIRLNLRDHGGTHALNRELFHSCRLPEVVGAVARVQALFPAHRLLLAGYSLGGNFCLRVGARAPRAGIRIARIVAVCPVLDPAATLDALETGPSVYRNYFLLKWRRSLRLKQAAWPGDYDFGELIRDPSLTTMTERMVLKYTDFPDLATYLRGYAITGNVLESLEAPAHLLTSEDDPMIHTCDLAGVARPPSLEITVTPRGGHCGYMDAVGGPSWVDRRIADELANA
ncbi:MAG TPA: alpha/beta fold hydrolase [Steroidobacteraceae bacterium]|nr:alpha/beta fold hydrolase [Steroidobacteraceae bacterium]